ncbi:endonuclease/exonuclease/phosphatase family protein [Pleionea mediterranea]|jgi:endonuclease/exonuclease/phosphatase family metal-dependent hydrolase|uniref:Endonuclease/exonuclease/phosphatase family metal-dependent hydrolase n=1 Tax=Pleionea mediterranea TaxID=523701 RepID=A0A316GDY5_9GAMM|nr:endonuclease/exonuclease/phosphatase family protein [Pleionea mediterranea]PWK52867.1 endonuclease/exonuclease/phosphatase family metal-dependent hydrolase [Pleionea mediterranea]
MLKQPATTQLTDNDENLRLKVLSFNIQVGIDTARYSDYLRKSWRHVLPHSGRHLNLTRIAKLIKDYDVVALQEVDAGSLRSNFINQVEFLAKRADFGHWHVQKNRNLANIAAHANGLLSKMPAEMVVDHTLPGLIPGRGALQVNFGGGEDSLVVMVVHLSLSKKAQMKQLRYIADSLSDHQNFVIMGDMNCEPHWLVEQLDKQGLATHMVNEYQPTYPSWNPKRSLDQILVSNSLQVEQVDVLPTVISDHLPIAMEITLPASLAKRIRSRHCPQNLTTYSL